jgi:carbon-monoxide dehydrogenase small subunit
MPKRTIELTVNGQRHSGEAEPRMLLSDFLREELGLTGTHVGCEHGVCGACTVMVNGETARSCLMFAVQASGAAVRTIEGLGTVDDMHPYNAKPSDEEIREAISSSLCRCTGYQTIVDAVRSAAERMGDRS